MRIDGDSLVSTADVRYSRGDMVALKRRSFSPEKTAVLGGGLFVSAFLFAMAAALGSLANGL